MAAHRTTTHRSSGIRAIAAAGLATLGMSLAPMAAALADDGPSSPATPTVRDADPGVAVTAAGTGEVRLADKGRIFGNTSAGAPILVHDGNLNKPTDGRQYIVRQHPLTSFCNRGEAGITVFCRDRGR